MIAPTPKRRWTNEQAREAVRRHGGYRDEMGYRDDEALGCALLMLEAERDALRAERDELYDKCARLVKRTGDCTSQIDKLLRETAAARARIEAMREVLHDCEVAMEHPYCKDTPEGHLAFEAIVRARSRARKARSDAALAQPQEGTDDAPKGGNK